MTDKEEACLAQLTTHLGAAHAGREPLAHGKLVTARALLRLADGGRLELTEDDQQRLDALHGLVRWGQLAYPLLRVDPGVFAAERRARRGRSSLLPTRSGRTSTSRD